MREKEKRSSKYFDQQNLTEQTVRVEKFSDLHYLMFLSVYYSPPLENLQMEIKLYKSFIFFGKTLSCQFIPPIKLFNTKLYIVSEFSNRNYFPLVTSCNKKN